MKTLKNVAFAGLCILGLSSLSTHAQPFYVPSTSLIAWYPFNGNADNEISPSNNGVVNGATPTFDRFGTSNAAYDFDGIDDYIDFGTTLLNSVSEATISCWIKTNDNGTRTKNVWQKRRSSNGDGFLLFLVNDYIGAGLNRQPAVFASPYVTSVNLLDSNWTHIVVVNDNGLLSLYVNGIFRNSISLSAGSLVASEPLYVGKGFDINPDGNGDRAYEGAIDDIGIWDRPLGDDEIWDLYRGCTNNVFAAQPTDQIKNVGANASFNPSVIATPVSYRWETNFGLGYQEIINVGQYSGASTSNLSVSNVQLRNHYQPFRCIVNMSSQCTDTSDVVHLILVDTCITTIYDTVQVTQLSLSLNESNTVKSKYQVEISPNPSNGQLRIASNFVDFATEKYEARIYTTDGRLVMIKNLMSNQEYLDIRENASLGIYFVVITNSKNEKIASTKVVIR